MAVDLIDDGILRFEEAKADPGLSSFQPLAGTGLPTATPPALGLCQLCNERDASQRCLNCERSVCRDDFWVMLGLCKSCSTPEENQAAREGRGRARPDLGIKWIED